MMNRRVSYSLETFPNIMKKIDYQQNISFFLFLCYIIINKNKIMLFVALALHLPGPISSDPLTRPDQSLTGQMYFLHFSVCWERCWNFLTFSFSLSQLHISDIQSGTNWVEYLIINWKKIFAFKVFFKGHSITFFKFYFEVLSYIPKKCI